MPGTWTLSATPRGRAWEDRSGHAPCALGLFLRYGGECSTVGGEVFSGEGERGRVGAVLLLTCVRLRRLEIKRREESLEEEDRGEEDVRVTLFVTSTHYCCSSAGHR